jgi:hypothetical protein
VQRLTVQRTISKRTQHDVTQSHEPSSILETLLGFANSWPPALGFANELPVELAQSRGDHSILELLQRANRRATELEERGWPSRVDDAELPHGRPLGWRFDTPPLRRYPCQASRGGFRVAGQLPRRRGEQLLSSSWKSPPLSCAMQGPRRCLPFVRFVAVLPHSSRSQIDRQRSVPQPCGYDVRRREACDHDARR